ncbi:hypothetical protein BJ878DRAFT_500503 [Calycina marina]|uniref:Plastocyanin-like domain-containing protein n=1 Tax=Calycina marina TaxID=1763456 RepID=A0A9P7Z6C8_9HELO|nr:hypothetical protein BJ878DRAFT_500503 [Calycina marina]
MLANYAPWAGVYMFHCHNLVHEGHDMMGTFNVTGVDLMAFVHPDKVKFTDPMTTLIHAKPLSGTEILQRQNELLPSF